MKDLNFGRQIDAFWSDIQTYIFSNRKSLPNHAFAERESLVTNIGYQLKNQQAVGKNNFSEKVTSKYDALFQSSGFPLSSNEFRGLNTLPDASISSPETTTYLDSQEEVFIRRIVRLIFRYLSDPRLDVSFLAEHLFLSSSQLNRRMRAIIKCSAGNFIRNIRLQYAAKLLLNNVASVGEISAEVGYQNQASFCRSFKKKFGCAPSRFSSLQEKTNQSCTKMVK